MITVQNSFFQFVSSLSSIVQEAPKYLNDYTKLTAGMMRKAELETRIRALPDKSKYVEIITDLIRHPAVCRADNPIFKDNNFVLHLLNTLKVNAISINEFERLIQFYKYVKFLNMPPVNNGKDLPSPMLLPKSEMEAAEIFHEVTRRLPKTALAQIEEQLSKRELFAKEIHALVTEDLSMENFSGGRLPIIALAALKAGQLSQIQYGTLMWFWQCFQDNKKAKTPDVVNIFSEKLPVSTILRQSLCTLSIDNPLEELLQNEERQAPKNPLLTEEELKEFLALVSQMPKSEQQFLLFEHDQDKEFQHKKGTVTQEICYYTGLNVFSRVVINGKIYKMIPSMGMVQALLFTLSREKDKPVMLNPVLGKSSVFDIRLNVLRRIRDVGLQSPFAPQPEKADGAPAPGTEFTEHDCTYHGLLAAYIFASHCKQIVDVADSLQDLRPYGVGGFWYSLLDLEFNEYRKQGMKGVSFWESIVLAFKKKVPIQNEDLALRRIVRSMLQSLNKETGIDESSLDFCSREINSQNITDILSKIKEIYKEYKGDLKNRIKDLITANNMSFARGME